MAVYSGTAGSVLYGGTAGTAIGELKSWTVDVAVAELDASSFGTGWAETEGGIKSWSGSFDGNADYSDTYQAAMWTALQGGTKVELVMKHSGTAYMRGTAVITGVSETQTFDGLGETTWSFRGDGAISRT